MLEEAQRARGQLPAVIQCDNGTEFTAISLDLWAYTHGVQLDFSRPGKPADNGVREAFNGSVRRECLTRHWFGSLAEAQSTLQQKQDEYNNFRPHTSLGLRTPAGTPRDGGYRPRRLQAVDQRFDPDSIRGTPPTPDASDPAWT